jgi:hypothetical protein
MVCNSDIEAGSKPFTSKVVSGTAVQSRSISKYVSASHSLQTVVTSAKAIADWQQLIPGIMPSFKYRFRIHIYAINVTPGSHAVELQWLDTNGSRISTTSVCSSKANIWVEKTIENITPPAGATQVLLLMRGFKKGTYYFDDPVMLPQGNTVALIDGKFPIGLYNLPTYNLLKNSSLEFSGNCSQTPDGTGTDQNPLIWYRGEIAGNPVPVQRFDHASNCISIVMNSNGVSDWRQMVAEIDTDSIYQLQCNIKASNVEAGSHAIELHWFGANDKFLGSVINSSTLPDQWYNTVTLNITPPKGTRKAYVMTRTYKPGTYSFRNIYLQVQPSLYEIPRLLGEVKDAGFNFITFYQDHPDAQPFLLDDLTKAGLKAACFLTADASYSQIINAVSNSPALALWSQPDEAAWRDPPIDPKLLENNYNAIVSGGDPSYTKAPHLIWLNHAPRGSQVAPADFYGSLSPYKTAADIISTDIYPVPTGNRHSSLLNQTISCVGDYVDIFANPSPPMGQKYAIASDHGVQTKPIWMALQGYGWQDHLLLSDNPHAYDSHRVLLNWFDAADQILRSDMFCSQIANEWFNLRIPNIAPPPGATKVRLILRACSPGTFYFDDVALTRVSDGVNMVNNSGIETADGANPSNWKSETEKWNPTLADPIFTWDVKQYHTGSHSLKTFMSTCGTADWTQLASGIDSSQRYSLSVFIHADSLKYERPTWVETRFMAYDAIINGARGVTYYGCYYVPMRSQLWTDIKRIAKELNTLSTALVSPTSFRNVTTNAQDSIETCLLQNNGYLYLLAANKSDHLVRNAEIHISGLPLNTAIECFDAGEPLKITSNSLKRDFNAYQVYVYKLK